MAQLRPMRDRCLTVKLDRSEGQLKVIAGSHSDIANGVLANQAIRTAWIPTNASAGYKQEQETAAVLAMMAFQPQDQSNCSPR